MTSLLVRRLGRVEYDDGLRLQSLVGQARAQDASADTLLLLEHGPVLTLGRGAKKENVLASPQKLSDLGVGVYETNRGGDVTYHGPGQLVGYPILKLPPQKQDVRKYVTNLEEAIIRTLAKFNIPARRIPNWTGVWVGDGSKAEKIAAIGVHLSRWQTSHGFALNVAPNLDHFQLIVPCGIREAGVTSMAKVLGREIPVPEVEETLIRCFAEVFQTDVSQQAPDMQTVAVGVVRDSPKGMQVLCLRRTPARRGFWQCVTGRVEPGETPVEAAAREVFEETGQRLRIEDLHYRHAFAMEERVPPFVLEETAFAARWETSAEVRISPDEHDAYEWLSLEDALERFPFEGLRQTVRRAAAMKTSR